MERSTKLCDTYTYTYIHTYRAGDCESCVYAHTLVHAYIQTYIRGLLRFSSFLMYICIHTYTPCRRLCGALQSYVERNKRGRTCMHMYYTHTYTYMHAHQCIYTDTYIHKNRAGDYGALYKAVWRGTSVVAKKVEGKVSTPVYAYVHAYMYVHVCMCTYVHVRWCTHR